MTSPKELKYYLDLEYAIELQRDADEAGEGYVASHPDLRGCIAQGSTADEAVEALAVARELWIKSKLEDGLDVPEPLRTEPSGRILVRTAPTLHYELARAAQRSGVSLNALINSLLVSALERRSALEAMVELADGIADSIATRLTPQRENIMFQPLRAANWYSTAANQASSGERKRARSSVGSQAEECSEDMAGRLIA